MARMQTLFVLLVGLITSSVCVAVNEPQQNGQEQSGKNMDLASKEIVSQCGSKPNCVSSSTYNLSESEQPKWYIEPLAYEHSAVEGQKAFDILVAVLKAEKLALTINYPRIDAVATTKVFGYKDDLSFIVLGDKGIVHIRSESQKGHYDFGKNRRRLESIRNKFTVN